MVNGWKVTAIISMILAGIFLFLCISLGYSYALLDSEWTYEYNILDGDWCELYNDQTELVNNFIDLVQEYNYNTWKDTEYLEILDCELR